MNIRKLLKLGKYRALRDDPQMLYVANIMFDLVNKHNIRLTAIGSLKEYGVKIRKSTDITTVMRSMKMLEEEKLIDVFPTEDKRDFIIRHTPTGTKIFAQYGSYLRFDKEQRNEIKAKRVSRIMAIATILSLIIGSVASLYAIYTDLQLKQKNSEIKSLKLEIDSLKDIITNDSTIIDR